MTFPSPSLISHAEVDKLTYAMLRSQNKFLKGMCEKGIDDNWVTAYIEELTPDRCVYVVVYGFGIIEPIQENVRYEVKTDDLLNNLTPERIIPDDQG